MESLIATIVGSIVMGGVVGLIPYVAGKKKGLESMGQVCLVLCILGNFIAGLYLSIPVCLISLVGILVKKGTNATGNAQKAENPQISEHLPMQENFGQAGMQGQEAGNSQAGMQGQGAGNSQTAPVQGYGTAGGRKQDLFCAYCGTRNDAGSAYCMNCGRRMD